jgi:hypothetical protein
MKVYLLIEEPFDADPPVTRGVFDSADAAMSYYESEPKQYANEKPHDKWRAWSRFDDGDFSTPITTDGTPFGTVWVLKRDVLS